MDIQSSVVTIPEWGIKVSLDNFITNDEGIVFDIHYDKSDLERLQLTEGELKEKVTELIETAILWALKRDKAK